MYSALQIMEVQQAMTEYLMLAGFFVFWFVLQRYILPRMGIQT